MTNPNDDALMSEGLVERVARAACAFVNSADTWEETGTDVHEMVWFPIARAAIAVLRPAIRAEALREAAGVCRAIADDTWSPNGRECAKECANDILALTYKEKADE